MYTNSDRILALELEDFARIEIAKLTASASLANSETSLEQLEHSLRQKAEQLLIRAEKTNGFDIARVRIELRQALIQYHYKIKKLKNSCTLPAN